MFKIGPQNSARPQFSIEQDPGSGRINSCRARLLRMQAMKYGAG